MISCGRNPGCDFLRMLNSLERTESGRSWRWWDIRPSHRELFSRSLLKQDTNRQLQNVTRVGTVVRGRVREEGSLTWKIAVSRSEGAPNGGMSPVRDRFVGLEDILSIDCGETHVTAWRWHNNTFGFDESLSNRLDKTQQAPARLFFGWSLYRQREWLPRAELSCSTWIARLIASSRQTDAFCCIGFTMSFP